MKIFFFFALATSLAALGRVRDVNPHRGQATVVMTKAGEFAPGSTVYFFRSGKNVGTAQVTMGFHTKVNCKITAGSPQLGDTVSATNKAPKVDAGPKKVVFGENAIMSHEMLVEVAFEGQEKQERKLKLNAELALEVKGGSGYVGITTNLVKTIDVLWQNGALAATGVKLKDGSAFELSGLVAHELFSRIKPAADSRGNTIKGTISMKKIVRSAGNLADGVTVDVKIAAGSQRLTANGIYKLKVYCNELFTNELLVRNSGAEFTDSAVINPTDMTPGENTIEVRLVEVKEQGELMLDTDNNQMVGSRQVTSPNAKLGVVITAGQDSAVNLVAPGGLILFAQPVTEQTYPVRILFEPRPDAKFYQIEWLEDNQIKGQANAAAKKSLQEKITRTEIRRDLPTRFKYFRMRSAYRDNLFGPWGEVVEIQRVIAAKPTDNTKPTDGTIPTDTTKPVDISKPSVKKEQDVFVQVIDRDGKSKWVLRGTAVPIDRLTDTKPVFYDIECLTEKNAPENTNGRKLYESPIPFTRAGQYKMNFYTSDKPEAKEFHTWIFWVYTETPHSYVKFYAPFLHGKGGFTVGAKTKIALRTHHSQTAIDKIEYSIHTVGEKATAFKKYEDEFEVSTFANGKYGRFQIDYRATSVTGATETDQSRTILVDASGPTIDETERDGKKVLTFKDENFPIVVRIYKDGVLVFDHYYKQFKADDALDMPEAGSEIHAIDLLGNESVLKK